MGISNHLNFESSHSQGGKICYRPIEAAIRWSELLDFESDIIEALGERCLPGSGEFPQWPKLRYFAERILDGMEHSELPFLSAETHRRIKPLSAGPGPLIRHVDLKAWMTRYYPGDRPPFLFDGFERLIHPAVSVDALNILIAERDAARAQLATIGRQSEYAKGCNPSQRGEATYLNIIGGLINLMLGKSPSGVPYSSFLTQEAIISAMVAHHRGAMGITDRTLQAKFALARRNLSNGTA